MGPLTPIDSGTSSRIPAVSAVRAVAPAGDASDTAGRESGSVRLSARGTETAARETRERRTGDATIDRELADTAAAAMRTVTYSFYEKAMPAGDAEAQQARSVSDRQRVREALSFYASVANVQFVEVGAGGDVQYGVTPPPSPTALRASEARAEADAAEDKARAASNAAQAAEAEARADTDPAREQKTAQTDDIVGLNLNDPDGRGGRPIQG